MVTSLCVIPGEPSQLSVEVPRPVLVGVVSSIHSIVTLAGHVNIGGVLSSIVINCVPKLEFPHTSVAVHVRVMVYSCGQDGEDVVTSLYDVDGEASQMSLTVSIPVLAGKVSSVHSIVILAGTPSTGEVVSSTLIVWMISTLVLRQTSVTL